MSSPYDLKTPTRWASPPKLYSFTSLQTISSCPRRWQLLQSEWGDCARFPERSHPSAIEGQIVHAALDLLSRALGRRGRPALGSAEFQAAAEECGFWSYFSQQVAEWNARLAQHPRAGPRYVVRTPPRELANRAIRLFRERYTPGTAVDVPRAQQKRKGPVSEETPLSRLRQEGLLSELRIDHPKLPLMGILDLVTVDDAEQVTVADFKTGDAKETHRSQLLLYAVLWWRMTGSPPARVAVQYLDDGWDEPVSASELAKVEEAAERDIAVASRALSLRPAPARPSADCARCAVRARCDDGWPRSEAGKELGRAVDLELTVIAAPTEAGFIGQRLDGGELSVVYDYAVGRTLPEVQPGTRLRLIDVQPAEGGKAVEIRPWSEVYVL